MKIQDIKANQAIHIATREEYDRIMNLLDRNGKRWSSGGRMSYNDVYEMYTSSTAINVWNDVMYCNTGWYIQEGYEIIPSTEITNETMKKYILTRENAAKIYKNVCSSWQKTIDGLFPSVILESTEVSEVDINRAWEEANTTQRQLIKEIFPEYKKVAYIPKGQLAWVRGNMNVWETRFSAGDGGFYKLQERSGEIYYKWKEWQPFNEIPKEIQ